MCDSLRCPLNERFFITVSFDNKSAQAGRRKICLKLFYVDSEEDVLAKKTFLWPESKLPTEVNYLSENGIVQLIGLDNVAKIALNVDDMLLAWLRSAKLRSEPCSVYTTITKQRHLLPTDPMTTAVMNIINGEDVEHWWCELVELVKGSGNAEVPVQLRLSIFAPQRQEALLECICAHIGDDGASKAVLSSFVQQRIFTATDACKKILTLAERESWLDVAVDLIRCALNIDESVYALCLKMAANKMESGGEELLGALFNHRVTHNSLVGQLSDKLSAGEATILIDRLTALLVAHQVDNNTYRNVVELLTILVDGCAQKMLWDNECHDAIRRAADCITEQVLLADTISMFNYHLSDDSSRLRSENDVQYSDYIVESVTYQCRSL